MDPISSGEREAIARQGVRDHDAMLWEREVANMRRLIAAAPGGVDEAAGTVYHTMLTGSTHDNAMLARWVTIALVNAATAERELPTMDEITAALRQALSQSPPCRPGAGPCLEHGVPYAVQVLDHAGMLRVYQAVDRTPPVNPPGGHSALKDAIRQADPGAYWPIGSMAPAPCRICGHELMRGGPCMIRGCDGNMDTATSREVGPHWHCQSRCLCTTHGCYPADQPPE